MLSFLPLMIFSTSLLGIVYLPVGVLAAFVMLWYIHLCSVALLIPSIFLASFGRSSSSFCVALMLYDVIRII